MADVGPLTEDERYAFDVQGFVVRRQALSRDELRMLRLAVVELGLARAGDTIGSQRFNGHLLRDGSFRDLIDHPAVLDVLLELCGANVRLDHSYGITMRPGSAGLGLHGGGTPPDPAQDYRVVDGRMFNGLVAVQWALVEHRMGDGGFGCIPGSHKASFRLPAPPDPRLVTEVALAAGDVVLFTEALTHCTIPWRGDGDRLTLLPLLTDRQRRLLQPPAVYPHQPVQPG
jgi:hypothetical protein